MASLLLTVLQSLSYAQGAELQLDKIKLPPGFQIQVFARGVNEARQLALGSNGTLFVGTSGDKVYAVTPAGKVLTLARDLNHPNGVAFQNGSLYVAEIHRVLRFDRIEEKLAEPSKAVVFYDKLPKDGHHGFRYIGFGPDGWLYLGIGAPCNVCERDDPHFGTITRISSDGSKAEVFARGVRNSVGFDWHPRTAELWFTDNGRDWLGDSIPPDELNVASAKNMDFGFPYCHAGRIKDPELGEKKSCSDTAPPVLELGPHVAPLGMSFYTGKMFPKEYRNQAIIAEHGSWNRSEPIGYRLTLVKLAEGRPAAYEVFAEGWLQGRTAWGRPVDLQVAGDGSLLVSDDFAGVVYKITAKP